MQDLICALLATALTIDATVYLCTEMIMEIDRVFNTRPTKGMEDGLHERDTS